MISLAVAMSVPVLAIIPQPASFAMGSGMYQLRSGAKIVAVGEAARTAEHLRRPLALSTGFALPIVKKGGEGDLVLRLDGKANVGEEGYRLSATAKQIEISARASAGLFYGVQTLLQMFPPDVFRTQKVDRIWSVPCAEIEDQPRFSWRGAHLDVARHFASASEVKRYIDLLAMHKMNVFHWHLTDDQGWRIEIKKYPKLTSVGGFRKDTMLNYDPAQFSGKPHGGFYTQDEIRDVVKYAAERHITIVPEIEMPGHAQAAIAAYPELGNVDEPLEVFTRWGVNPNVFNTDPKTIRFLQDVLDEVIALFPGDFIHVGGDECPKEQWKASAKVQAHMKEVGAKDEHAMQSWFIGQMDKYLASKGRRLIGWSEILEGGLAEKAALMVWLGSDGAMEAVRSGHDVVMAQTSATYLDYYQSRNRALEPKAIGGYLPLHQVYRYEPVLPDMTPEEGKRVMGAQFQIWTEYIPNFRQVEYMAYPRGCALAEVVWSPKASRDFTSFQSRLAVHEMRLNALGVNARHTPESEMPMASWIPAMVAAEPKTMEWNLERTVNAGPHRLHFGFVSGQHGLAISSVEVLVDGTSVFSTATDTFAGGKARGTDFHFSVPNRGHRLTLRIVARGDGGTDSTGDVFLEER